MDGIVFLRAKEQYISILNFIVKIILNSYYLLFEGSVVLCSAQDSHEQNYERNDCLRTVIHCPGDVLSNVSSRAFLLTLIGERFENALREWGIKSCTPHEPMLMRTNSTTCQIHDIHGQYETYYQQIGLAD